MSFYNSSVKTHIINPVYHSNSKTELRLEDLYYFSNFRLCNVGAVVTGKTDLSYPVNSGALSLIQNVHLYSSGTVVDPARDVHMISAFKSMLKSNGECANLSKELQHTAQGYEVNDSNDLIDATGNPVDKVTNNAGTTSRSWIDLRSIFGTLKSMSFVNCEKLSHMRVVIEWRTDFKNLFQGDCGALTACDILEPQLIVDQVLSEKTISKIKSMTATNKQSPFIGMEVDRVTISACADTVTENDQHKLNAFNNKLVNRLLFIPQDRTAGVVQDADNIVKLDRADQYKDEEWQVILNNRHVFDYKGVDSSARKLSVLADTFGDLCLPYGSTMYGVNKSDKLFTTDSIPVRLVGKCGYFGMQADERVSNLQLRYKRTGFAAHPAFRMNVVGEVLKAIQYTNDGFNIVYL